MRVARLIFDRMFLMSQNGLKKDFMHQILDKLPADASIVGFGESPVSLASYIFVHSDSFKDIDEGSIPPDIVVVITKTVDGIERVTDLDMFYALDSNKSPVKQFCILHQWETYTGLMASYEYCRICGEKKNP